MLDADPKCSIEPSVSTSPSSAHGATARPHDLLWPRRRLDLITSTELPAWASDEWQAQAPVVVRRERMAEPAMIPVGLRGRTRSERHAAYVHHDRVERCVAPESLARPDAWMRYPDLANAPCIQALIGLAAALDETQLVWGVTGSAGFSLSTGMCMVRHDSDLDLLLRAPRRMSRDEASAIIGVLRRAPVRVDAQVETTRGAFALAEWAAGSARVLLKTDGGPMLVDDPWHCETMHFA
jgi:phosphoribosyl-dephospho-CoA transferase